MINVMLFEGSSFSLNLGHYLESKREIISSACSAGGDSYSGNGLTGRCTVTLGAAYGGGCEPRDLGAPSRGGRTAPGGRPQTTARAAEPQSPDGLGHLAPSSRHQEWIGMEEWFSLKTTQTRGCA